MVSILVIDDNKVKVDSYITVFSQLQIGEGSIAYASSIIDAKRILAKTQFDIMLLDLSLPLRVDTEPSQQAGMELLFELHYMDTYKMPHNIIAISEYDDALKDLQTESDKFYFSLIKYDATSDDWRNRLSTYIKQIIRAQEENTFIYEYDAAIICALESPELYEILKLPFKWQAYNKLGDTTDYFTGTFKDRRLLCAAAYEMGMPAASVLATKILSVFKPNYLVMTGIAAGVGRDKLHFGDIMVADPCFDYGSGKRVFENGRSKFKPDYRQVRLNDKVCQIIKRIANSPELLQEIKRNCPYDKPKEPLQLKIGPFASGAAVLSDLSAVNDILEHSRKLIGFDMEAYGVMLSGMLSSTPKTIPVVLKSVSDFGDSEKANQYQRYASYTSANALYYFLDMLF